MTDPRNKNGSLRRRNRQRFKVMQCPCGICKGMLGPIHYDEPSDSKHPLSFVIDEIIPVSKYYLGGYRDPRAAAEDFNNLTAAHYICNQLKSNKINFSTKKLIKKLNLGDAGTAQTPKNEYKTDGKW